MERLFHLLLLIFAAPASGATALCPDTDPPVETTVHLRIDNVGVARGTVWIGVYTSEEDFLDREKARLVALKITATGRAYVDIPDLVIGEDYAFGIFHDVNDNGEMDLNWLGLPTEPWAFSGKPKTRLRLPRFGEVSFRVTPDATAKTLRLRRW